MINSLKIQNFRMLEDFEVNNLGRVNLIVGKNNSGKSTVLEALRILAGNAHPELLQLISKEHDEGTTIHIAENRSLVLPFQNFFTGRLFPETDDTEIYIGELDPKTKRFVKISHVYLSLETEELKDTDGDIVVRTKQKPIKKPLKSLLAKLRSRQALKIKTGRSKKDVFLSLIQPEPFEFSASLENTPASYIPTRLTSIDDLADIWDTVQFLDYGAFVKESLAIICEDFENLAFVKRNDGYDGELKRTCQIKLKGINRAVPLNSMGDGMLRILQLILKTYPAQGGFLLIDEFENGLHFSVQKQVWDLLFKLAEKLDIQVFATTHSWDCIESFAEVAKDRKDNQGVLFRMGRSIRASDRGKVIATVFDSEKLASLTQADVEVR